MKNTETELAINFNKLINQFEIKKDRYIRRYPENQVIINDYDDVIYYLLRMKALLTGNVESPAYPHGTLNTVSDYKDGLIRIATRFNYKLELGCPVRNILRLMQPRQLLAA